MHELRNRAQQEVGERFDYREYHETVLRMATPLNILEKNVDYFTQSEK